MIKKVKHSLVACEGNEHRPHLLRRAGVVALSIVAIISFTFALTQSAILRDSDFLAAILPSVLTQKANETRSIYDLGNLKTSSVLEQAARLKAQDMAARQYFAHNSPDGKTPWHWFDAAGYDYVYAGENLAINFTDSGQVHSAWLASPTHRANIINGNFTEIGIATAEGMYQGRPTTFVVQMFGRPLVASAPITPVAVASEEPEVVTPDVPEPESVQPVIETDTYVAVADEEVVGETRYFVIGERIISQESVQDQEDTLGASNYALSEELFSSPKTVLSYIYLILTLLVLFVVVGSLFGHGRKHRHKNVASAVFLFFLMVLLVYAYDFFVLSDVVVL